MNKRKIGDNYEQVAVSCLEREGYRILERNFRNRYGEIDIIAKEQEYICFCEVKYRKNSDCGGALEAVDYRKQRKIINVARYYMMTHGMNEWTPCRFDVIAVDGEKVTILRNAFEGY